jgi:hypothetical protein
MRSKYTEVAIEFIDLADDVNSGVVLEQPRAVGQSSRAIIARVRGDARESMSHEFFPVRGGFSGRTLETACPPIVLKLAL